MKIALDISVLYIAGAGVFYYRYNLIEAMLALPSAHEFVLLDCVSLPGGWIRHDPPEVETLSDSGADLRQVNSLKHRKLTHLGAFQKHRLLPLATGVDRVLDGFWSRLCTFDLSRRVRKCLRGVDLFHSSEVLQHAVPGAINVVTIYDLTTLLFPEYHIPLVRQFQDRKFRFAQTQADIVIAISESTKRDIVRHLGLDPGQVHVVYGGVKPSFRVLPPEIVASTLAPLGLLPQGYILNVGTIEPRKNLGRLVEAYAQLRQGWQRPIPKLVLVGTKGWLYDQVFERVQTLGLEDDVVFLGRAETGILPALYNGARLFVYPSLYEGFGLPPLEAMACGAPTITSNVSSLPEVVGDAALLVDPQNVGQIAEAMGDLLKDAEKREHLRERGLERATHFTWDMAAQRTLEVYERAVGAQ